MSQRLLIAGKNSIRGNIYDAIIDGGNTLTEAANILRYDFFADMGHGHLGPWKIRVADLEAYLKVEPILMGMFKYFDHIYPDEVWTFYRGDKTIDHPTERELLHFLWSDYEPE